MPIHHRFASVLSKPDPQEFPRIFFYDLAVKNKLFIGPSKPRQQEKIACPENCGGRTDFQPAG